MNAIVNALSGGGSDVGSLESLPQSFNPRFVLFVELYQPMIIYRMVIVEGRCDKLQLLISYIYDHWLTQKYSEF